ncbi:MCM DNA helicase complex subunit [Dipsacomyces acuminosporus]|nr:MCM DNA helicase complex subunit [Dipsacomyces acuminosporus]
MATTSYPGEPASFPGANANDSSNTQFTLPETNLAEDLFLERQRHCREFLERENRVNPDIEELERILSTEKPRLIISVDHIREFDIELAASLIAEPAEYIPAFEAAATELGLALASNSSVAVDQATFQIAVGFRGSFGSHHLTPRGLRASFLGQLVCIEGIVTRCSLVRPKVVRSVHYSEATKTFFAKNYHDQTSSVGGNTKNAGFSSAYPTTDDKGNPLTTEYGYSKYMDHQTVNVQEMPERAPPGQLPRGVDIMLDDDLVDTVKPGDRVSLVGVYRALGGKAATAASAIFRTVILVNSVRVFGAGSLAAAGSSNASAKDLNQRANATGLAGAITLADGDIRNIHAVAKREDVFEILSQSLAPSICGHSEIKRAVLLQLLGGMEKNLENGTHIRGDINILMVGDPSTAKSQMLRYVLRIAPLAIATTGRGSSGVGLTAAVVSDKETGERRLEAGAMVLADRGVVCIDEFDKMTDVDRVAIHEVMEQQTVTVAKAGIHTTLNARCSVLAAANPVYGRYDPKRPPHQNIALPDSLLSRFDLLFIVTDSMDEARDRLISSHVLRMHRYVPPGVEVGQPVSDLLDQGLGTAQLLAGLNSNDNGAAAGLDEDEDSSNRPCQVFEPYNEYLHAGVAAPQSSRRRTRSRSRRALLSSSDESSEQKREVLSTEFLRRYLYFAKNMVRPVLSSEAADDLANAYAELRAQASGQGLDGRGSTGAVQTTTPITARTLETLIRLATAHAKVRLSSTVDAQDAEVAKSLLRFALFKEQASKPQKGKKSAAQHQQKRARTANQADSDDDDDEDEDAGDGDIPSASENEHETGAAEDGGLRPMQISKTRASTRSMPGSQPNASDDAMDVDEQGPAILAGSTDDSALSRERMALFRTQLSRAIAERRLDAADSPWSFPDPFLSAINDGLSDADSFSPAQAEKALLEMQDENRLMFRDNMIIMMFDELAQTLDIAEIEHAYRLLELEEARVDVEISEHIESREDADRQFAQLFGLQKSLGLVVDQIVPVQTAIDATAANAGAISGRVRFLDQELTKLEHAVKIVNETEELKRNTTELLAAMKEKNVDLAAGLIHRYITTRPEVLSSPFVRFASPNSDAYSSGKPPGEIISDAKRELVERVSFMFESAVESSNTKEISRCFRLFPLLGEEQRGLDMYSEFLCNIIAEKSRVSGELKGNVYAVRLTRLFEVIAVVVDNHFPLVETHYGPGRMIRVIQRLQIEGAKRANMVLDFFEEERHVKRRVSQIQQADASVAKAKSYAKLHLLSADGERSGRTSEEQISEDDFKDITSILGELVLIQRQIAMFNRFMESRAKPELEALIAETGDFSGAFLKPETVAKLIPLSMQGMLGADTGSGLSKNSVEFDEGTGLIKHTPLTARLSWLTDTYVTLEKLFVSRSVAKAMVLDDTDSLLGWTDAVSSDVGGGGGSYAAKKKQTAESGSATGNRWNKPHASSLARQAMSTVQTSSCVGDVFFVIKTALEHAISIQQPSAVEVVSQYIIGITNSMFLSAIETRALGKWNDRSIQPSLASDQLSPAAYNQRQILVAVNNLDLSCDYLSKTAEALRSRINSEWQRTGRAEYTARANKAIDTFAAFSGKFVHAKQRSLEQIGALALKPWIRAILQQSYRDIKYVLTDEEFNDMQNDNLFQQRFVLKLGHLTRQMKARLTSNNFKSIFEIIVGLLVVDWERAIRQSKFNMLGGIMFEKDVREIQRYLEQDSGLALRPKFARLVQMADALAVEGAADAQHLLDGQPASSASNQASISNDEMKSLLGNRIDIPEKDIRELRA